MLDTVRKQIKDIALELGVIGLMNVQMAIKGDSIF